jgi:hypothetical protein
VRITFTDESILVFLPIHRPQDIQCMPSSQSPDRISHRCSVAVIVVIAVVLVVTLWQGSRFGGDWLSEYHRAEGAPKLTRSRPLPGCKRGFFILYLAPSSIISSAAFSEWILLIRSNQECSYVFALPPSPTLTPASLRLPQHQCWCPLPYFLLFGIEIGSSETDT